MATSWTDSTLSTSIKVKATHVTELKTAVNTLISNAGLSSSITLGTITTTGKILKSNISNLQKAVNSLQSSFSNNCTKTCQSNKQCKCQTCQTNKQCKCQKCQNCDCSDSDN